jgi:protein FAM50
MSFVRTILSSRDYHSYDLPCASMAETPHSSVEPSRSSTPAKNTSSSRFTAQNQTAEDVLKEQTVGLVHLSDFRKRRAEALEQVSREVTPGAAGSGATTPDGR